MSFNYKSDYALNKYRKDEIVYQSVNGGFICLNGNNCPDFLQWKAWSDEDYNIRESEEVKTTRRNISIHGLEETALTCSESPEDILIRSEEPDHDKLPKVQITMAFGKEMMEQLLTEIQKKRFVMHYYQNMSFRAIAAAESGIDPMAAHKSVKQAEKKFKKFIAAL